MNNLIGLQNLRQISRGDKYRMEKYLRQFALLIPERIEMITKALIAEDRAEIRQLVHKISPQIQFFGIDKVVELKNKLETGYLNMDFGELEKMVNQLLDELTQALEEVNNLLTHNNF